MLNSGPHISHDTGTSRFNPAWNKFWEIQSHSQGIVYHFSTLKWTGRLTQWPLEDVAVILKSIIFKLVASTLAVKLLPGECHRTSLMRSQHWFRYWFAVARQQAITWASVDPGLWRPMASSHNELKSFHVGDTDSFIMRSQYSVYRGHLSSYNSRRTPHSSPVRARYGVSFVSANLTEVLSL